MHRLNATYTPNEMQKHGRCFHKPRRELIGNASPAGVLETGPPHREVTVSSTSIRENNNNNSNTVLYRKISINRTQAPFIFLIGLMQSIIGFEYLQ